VTGVADRLEGGDLGVGTGEEGEEDGDHRETPWVELREGAQTVESE